MMLTTKTSITLSDEERAQINFDHPDSLDTELLIVKHVKQLQKGNAVEIPTYDFSRHYTFGRN